MAVALVTGGASGLGEAIALALGDDGWDVVVADIDELGSSRVAAAIGGRSIGVVADVTSDAAVAAAVARARQLGPLTALVLSAAVEVRKPLVDTTDEDWQRVLDVNLKGPFLCLRHVLPAMAEAGGGSVVALGSVLGSIVAPEYSAYCASKGALVNLCKQAAIEHAGQGIRVNVLAPSACEAGLFMEVTSLAPDPDAVRRMVADRTPMGRLGSVDDVVGAVQWLLGDSSSYISGTVIPLDGGMAARRQHP